MSSNSNGICENHLNSDYKRTYLSRKLEDKWPMYLSISVMELHIIANRDIQPQLNLN